MSRVATISTPGSATLPADERSYVIYAPTPWESARHATHNLADALAAHHAVLYIDPPLSPLSPIRYGLRRSTLPRVRAVVDRRLRTSGRLRVFGPLVLPPIEHPRSRALSLPLLRAQIRRAVARAGLERPVVLAWRGLPELAGVAGESLRVGVVMDHPSAGASLLGRDAAELEAEAEALCRSAELICTTSYPMKELLAERGWDSEHVAFGFPADLIGAYDGAAEPPEYAALPRPLLGYTGGIDDRLNFDLILRLADRFSNGSLVFVGPLSPRLSGSARAALAARANIHLLGPRPRAQLPAYIRYLDVALMPYADTLFTRYQSPMKLWEYLYAGPPIVASGATELRRYPPSLVSYAESVDAAPALAERALADPAAGRDARRSLALANNWDDRAVQIVALVAGRLNARPRKLETYCPDAELSRCSPSNTTPPTPAASMR
jgi:teichuronic acid biosynthesis glycosyltransferase TuaH